MVGNQRHEALPALYLKTTEGEAQAGSAEEPAANWAPPAEDHHCTKPIKPLPIDLKVHPQLAQEAGHPVDLFWQYNPGVARVRLRSRVYCAGSGSRPSTQTDPPLPASA